MSPENPRQTIGCANNGNKSTANKSLAIDNPAQVSNQINALFTRRLEATFMGRHFFAGGFVHGKLRKKKVFLVTQQRRR